MITKKRELRTNDEADERLITIFVFFATFLAGTSLIIVSMSGMLTWAESGNFEYSSVRQQIGNETYSLIQADDGNATDWYSVTDDDYVGRMIKDSENNFYFTNTVTSDELQVRPVEDEGWIETPAAQADAIVIFERWGWWTTEWSYVKFEVIKTNQLVDSNFSVTPFVSHGNKYDLIIQTPGSAETFNSYLDDHTYWMAISYDPLDPDNLATTSLWGIIGQILTAQIPDVHWAIQMFITIPVWAAISFMVFTVISRVIPFIGGG